MKDRYAGIDAMVRVASRLHDRLDEARTTTSVVAHELTRLREAYEIRGRAMVESSKVHMALAKMRDDILALHYPVMAVIDPYLDPRPICPSCLRPYPCATARIAQARLPDTGSTETR